MEVTQIQNQFATVVQKAWDDTSFKNELIANPVNAIESLIGIRVNMPVGHKFIVVDQTDEKTTYFNIPKDTRNIELTDEQLESVSGGENRNLGQAIGYAIGQALHAYCEFVGKHPEIMNAPIMY